VVSVRSKLPEDLPAALALVAPGSEIREAVEKILQAGNGALILFADPELLRDGDLVHGGFELGCGLTAPRIYELSKMDGAIVVSADLATVRYAGVGLTPDPDIPSAETGMRHLAAHRAAQQSGAMALAISERRSTVTLYLGARRPRLLDPVRVVLGKADSALVTLEKFAGRLRERARLLTVHEYEGTAPLSEVVGALETFEETARIAAEIRSYLTELGEEGGLISLQLEQSTHWIPAQRKALLRDYVSESVSYEEAEARLQALDLAQLSDGSLLARALGYERAELSEDLPLDPRGHRQLSQIPRLPDTVRRRLVEEFGSLNRLTGATEDELSRVPGVGKTRARAITRGLRRSRQLELPAEFS
jgi:diadenylate cyclase